MIYCVVPEELADQLFDKLTEHFKDDENVTVIVERRKRSRRSPGGSPGVEEVRFIRDRRRRRIVGEIPATPPGE